MKLSMNIVVALVILVTLGLASVSMGADPVAPVEESTGRYFLVPEMESGSSQISTGVRQFERHLAFSPAVGKLGDNECAVLARDIAKRVEDEMQYPGQIKITVLREIRVSEYAK